VIYFTHNYTIMRPIIQSIQRVAELAKNKVSPSQKITLSDFFPKGTIYFYGYPSGEESGFLNLVPPSVEELVAARPLRCLGSDMSVVCFSATTNASVNPSILSALNLNDAKDRIIHFPENINEKLTGAKRNEEIRKFLNNEIPAGRLVMAQPFLNDETQHLFQINPDLSNWLNDKRNMGDYIDVSMMPERLGFFNNGEELSNGRMNIAAPCVIKVTSSSAGDGVYICRDEKTLLASVESLASVQGSILVEKLVNEMKNYGVQFAVPSKVDSPISIIGFSEQVVTPEGEFMGGIIQAGCVPKELEPAIKIVRDEILPKIRAMGWYGIGCFDVLIDEAERHYFIDCNFRMTGMSAFLILQHNGELPPNLLTFNSEFEGTENDFESRIVPLSIPSSENKLHIVALSRNKNIWRLNCAISFNSVEDLKETAHLMLKHGLQSKVLHQSEELGIKNDNEQN
jgi:hypothetical protein